MLDIAKIKNELTNINTPTQAVSLKSTSLAQRSVSIKARNGTSHHLDLPKGTFLLADTSGSMSGEKLSALKEALSAFIDKPLDIYEFNSNVDKIHDLAYLLNTRARGSTYMYEALNTCYIQQAKRIIMITDGQPTDASREDILALVQSKQVPIDCIALPGDVDIEFLTKLTKLSGGGSVSKIEDLKLLGQEIKGMIEYDPKSKTEGVIQL